MRENETLTQEKLNSYLFTLQDVPLAQLERGLRRAAKECVWFPTPADIRKFAYADVQANDELEAHKAWERLQQTIRRHWYGELLPVMSSKKPENWKGRIQEHNGGYLLFPEPFDAAMDYAIRNAGGLQRIVNAIEESNREIDFVKRDFLANHKRHRETVGLLAPSREEARALLDKLQGLKGGSDE